MIKWKHKLALVALPALLLAGCRIGPIQVTVPTATPPPGAERVLVYKGPVTLSVDAGGFIPGTNVRYVGSTAEGAELRFGDLKAIKKVADSVDWEGTPAEGVRLDLHARVVRFSPQELNLAGTVQITVADPEPEPGEVGEEAPIHYTAPVAYNVARGETIPGTTITYVGEKEQGAELGGVEGYPYRKALDSIVWKGRLRPNVTLELNLRVVRYTEKDLQVTGLADLGLVKLSNSRDVLLSLRLMTPSQTALAAM